MYQVDAFGHPLEPVPGHMPPAPSAAQRARRDAEYGVAGDEPADADDIFGTVPPEHSWPGTGLVLALYAGAGLSLVNAVYLLANFGWESLSQVLAALPMMLFPGALMLWLARTIQQFRAAGLGVALLGLLSLLAVDLVWLWRTESLATIATCLAGVPLLMLWIGYLWARRDEFS